MLALIETPISTANEVGATGGGTTASEARFATSVAAFGQILRGGRYTGDYGYDDVIALANANKGADEFGYRARVREPGAAGEERRVDGALQRQ